MKSEFVTINDKRVHYLRGGRGRSIILIHGWNQSLQTWGRLIPMLEKNFDVIAVDLLGCGESDRLEEYTLENEVDYVVGLCKKLRLKKSILVGVSLGCYVALEMAAASVSFDGVVLVGLVYREGVNRWSHGLMRGSLKLLGATPVTSKLPKRVVNNDRFADLTGKWLQMREYDQTLGEDLRHGRELIDYQAVIDLGVVSTSVNVDELMKSCQVRTLVVQGEDDRFEHIKRVEKKVSKLGGEIKVKRVNNCGHTVQLEKPSVLAAMIQEFSTNSR